METGKEGQEKSMKKLMKWIKRRKFERLCKIYPVLKYNNELVAIGKRLKEMYNDRFEDVLKICDLLHFRHFYNCNQLLYYIFIDAGVYYYKIALIDPKLMNEIKDTNPQIFNSDGTP